MLKKNYNFVIVYSKKSRKLYKYLLNLATKAHHSHYQNESLFIKASATDFKNAKLKKCFMGIHCNHAKPLSPFFRKNSFPKTTVFFLNVTAFCLKHGHVLKKRHHVSGTCNNKKAKKYSYFFANSSNVLPSNWQIAFL